MVKWLVKTEKKSRLLVCLAEFIPHELACPV